MTKSWTSPRSSIVVITPERAPVSARALSTTSSSTVAKSRLRLMRRIAALSREMRASEAPVGSRSFNAPLPPEGEAELRRLRPIRPGRVPQGEWRIALFE